MTQSLTEIISEAAELEALFAELDPNDQESLQLFYQKLDELKQAEGAKVDRWVWYLKKLENEVKFLKEQEAELATIRRRAERKLEEGKNYLLLLHSGGQIPQKLKGASSTISIQKNSQPSVDVQSDPGEWEPKYWHLRQVTYSANRKAIAQTLAEGSDIPPGCIVETGNHVRLNLGKK